jgi:hypothetical protein
MKMTDVKKVDDWNMMRLQILRLLMNDTAAAQEAIKFISDDQLKCELFMDNYKQVQTETEVVARTLKAIDEAKKALVLFDK